jgi:catechol 2,3-dioxygenase-like lactoylglutathione lyase family enzyme
MVHNYDETIEVLGRIVGLRALEYTSRVSTGRRSGMTWVGDNSLEAAQPIVAGHAAERFLARRGPGLHSYAFQVSDLEATIDLFAAAGVTMGVRPAPGFFFTDPRSTGGLLFEWSDFTADEDPRTGAALPARACEPMLEISTHAFVPGAMRSGSVFRAWQTPPQPSELVISGPSAGPTRPSSSTRPRRARSRWYWSRNFSPATLVGSASNNLDRSFG